MPSFQRSQPAPRSYVREAPRPMPAVRAEPARPSFQQPHYQPPPRRAETRVRNAANHAPDKKPRHA